MQKSAVKPIYPCLFSIYPVLYLISTNSRALCFEDVIKALLLALVLGLFLYGSFFLILKNPDKAALVCALFILLFFSFGHIGNLLSLFEIKYLDFYLTILWGLIFSGLTYCILRTQNPSRFRIFLNSIAGILVIANLLFIVLVFLSSPKAEINSDKLWPLTQPARTAIAGHPQPAPSEDLPDIYYIILDSYERADKLQQYYHFDNSGFIYALESRGFYVAGASRSNYLFTYYSLPSSMNMIYLNDLPPDIFSSLTSSLKTSYVLDFLKLQGYKVIQFKSGDWVTDQLNADVSVNQSVSQTTTYRLNAFELMLAQTTLLHTFYNFLSPWNNETQHDLRNSLVQDNFIQQRFNIQNTFLHLPDYAGQNGPFFIFAHVPSPHYPYIFGPNGENVDINAANYLLNTGLKDHSPYTNQMLYINQLTLDSIDRILSQSSKPPVIILASDHGHDLIFDPEKPDAAGLDLRSANLIAIYYPDQAYQALYPSISPVNIFRSVFNHVFGASFPLLLDITYYHPAPDLKAVSSTVRFQDACLLYNICAVERQQ
ncbi:MAG: LTA synthase family protein [Anaerolineae bacterium]|nr:LTA synthase family protein [Anaerolineae bacterium]